MILFSMNFPALTPLRLPRAVKRQRPGYRRELPGLFDLLESCVPKHPRQQPLHVDGYFFRSGCEECHQPGVEGTRRAEIDDVQPTASSQDAEHFAGCPPLIVSSQVMKHQA